jgi:hypothetical protein
MLSELKTMVEIDLKAEQETIRLEQNCQSLGSGIQEVCGIYFYSYYCRFIRPIKYHGCPEMQVKSDTVTKDTRYYPIISDVIENIEAI